MNTTTYPSQTPATPIKQRREAHHFTPVLRKIDGNTASPEDVFDDSPTLTIKKGKQASLRVSSSDFLTPLKARFRGNLNLAAKRRRVSDSIVPMSDLDEDSPPPLKPRGKNLFGSEDQKVFASSSSDADFLSPATPTKPSSCEFSQHDVGEIAQNGKDILIESNPGEAYLSRLEDRYIFLPDSPTSFN
ncbi:hypothetical protein M422DRAFT_257825 [Sphaerobolus stellatus SS14]|uniref:Uncharacterized protein n=1 Tax=Sphaerobolus stellatus (strain SS14) TaxID=990650 RepID=A0A0C9UXA4_SPHS4|nr:hypothetical protein M422DRAFT_257825 [Sphaerobolus stellatus SS14]